MVKLLVAFLLLAQSLHAAHLISSYPKRMEHLLALAQLFKLRRVLQPISFLLALLARCLHLFASLAAMALRACCMAWASLVLTLCQAWQLSLLAVVDPQQLPIFRSMQQQRRHGVVTICTFRKWQVLHLMSCSFQRRRR